MAVRLTCVSQNPIPSCYNGGSDGHLAPGGRQAQELVGVCKQRDSVAATLSEMHLGGGLCLSEMPFQKLPCRVNKSTAASRRLGATSSHGTELHGIGYKERRSRGHIADMPRWHFSQAEAGTAWPAWRDATRLERQQSPVAVGLTGCPLCVRLKGSILVRHVHIGRDGGAKQDQLEWRLTVPLDVADALVSAHGCLFAICRRGRWSLGEWAHCWEAVRYRRGRDTRSQNAAAV